MGIKKAIQDRWLMLRCFLILGWRSCIFIIFTNLKTKPQRFLNRLIRKGAHNILKLFKAKYSIKFKQALPLNDKAIYIFLSNHLSLLDIPLIFATMPYTIRMMAKQELFNIPLLGKAMATAGCISINKDNPLQTIKNINANLEKFKQDMYLWVFPEGTRSHTGNLLPLKPGIFRLARELKAKIIPVGITGTNQALPPGSFSYTPEQDMKINVGSIIDTIEYSTYEQQKILMQITAQAICELSK